MKSSSKLVSTNVRNFPFSHIFLHRILLLLIIASSTSAAGIQPGLTGVGVCADATIACYEGTATIIHIGDSHVAGSYGQNLHAILSTQGYSVTSYGCVGADAQDYDEGTNCNPRLGSIRMSNQNLKQSLTLVSKQIISNNPSKIVIISLGTNFLNNEAVVNQAENINHLLDELPADSTCYWVGAPASTATNVNPTLINQELLPLVSSRCTFIDPTTMTSSTNLAGDHIHYNLEGGQKWADEVAKIIDPSVQLSILSPALINDESDNVLNDQSMSLSSQEENQPTSPTPTISSQTKNIDDAWLKFANLINPQLANKVFLPSRGWTDYPIAYPAPVTPSSPTSSPTSSPGTSTPYNLNLKVLPEEQKALVKLAVQAEGIPEHESLALKLVAAESSGNPNAISSTGCAGLMQICSISPVKDIIAHHCKQTKFLGPQMCGTLQDDRFIPEKNIRAGVRILKLNLKSTQNACTNANIQCGVAGYNIGAAVVKDAASRAGAGASWDQIYTLITPDVMRAHGYTSSYWTQDRLQQKINNLGPYIAKITSNQ